MHPPIPQDTVNQLKDLANASPAVKLFAEWCEKCTEDPLWRGRFKVNQTFRVALFRVILCAVIVLGPPCLVNHHG